MENKKYYAGIGSRQTPKQILKLMRVLAMGLAVENYVLRSGHAPGSDVAFEEGCDEVSGEKEIYLPWTGFENSNSNLVVYNTKAFELAEKYHPYWHNLSQGAKKLQARNSHQVLGQDLKTPVDFVICYTEKGKGKGGTGQAIRIASAYNIPVFDTGKYESNIDKLYEELNVFLNKYGEI